jgi:hypothetical protein
VVLGKPGRQPSRRVIAVEEFLMKLGEMALHLAIHIVENLVENASGN